MSKYTKGPWQVHQSHIYGVHPQRELVALARGNEGRMIANRNLIAAAPELLEALKAIFEGNFFYYKHGDEKVYQAAIAAIAKAEGREK